MKKISERESLLALSGRLSYSVRFVPEADAACIMAG